MSGYSKVNLMELDDQAARFGLVPNVEARMAREPLGLKNCGVSYQRFSPNFRVPFGHRHKQQEEVYVVINGSARMKLNSDVVDLKQWDAVRVAPNTMRAIEAGADGAELIIAAAPKTAPGDGEITPGWWSD